jgi:predicted DsbA family dithiol-disulfide isomerase
MGARRVTLDTVMPRSVAVTFDYLCPFARNAHEAIVAALRDGADLDVRFLPFSLEQSHVEEGEAPVWETPVDQLRRGVRALAYGLAVRDEFPESFVDFHLAAFAARHDQGRKFEADVLDEAVASVGLDVEAVRKVVDTGRPLEALAAEHTEAVDRWSVFGVPTFIAGDEAVFIRFMERGRVDDLDRALDLLDWTRLNEFKRTKIAR